MTVILCAELLVPENSTLVISSTLLGVDTTASYTCNQGHVLVGDVTRTCQDTSGGTATIGTWSGSDPTCELEIKLYYNQHNYYGTNYIIM